MQSNYRELITGISLTPPFLPPTGTFRPLSLAYASFSPIKQYLYANHPGLIATALHAWVIRVTIMVSRSPIVSFAAAGTYPRRFPRATVRGTQWCFIRGTRRILVEPHRAASLQNILIIPLSAFLASSETRPAGIIIVIMRLQKLGTRIVRRRNDLISREKRVGQVELILCGIYRNAEQFIMKKSNNFLRKEYTIKIRDRGS